MTYARPYHRQAFTLVEILVVVAIIALLVAILLPSLNKARESARMTLCLSNIRQIGMGMRMYMGDNRNWLPVGPADKLAYRIRDPVTGATRIVTELKPGMSLLQIIPMSNCHWGGRRAQIIHTYGKPAEPEKLKRPLTNYLYHGAGLDTETPLFQCPSDTGDELYELNNIREWRDAGRTPLYRLCGNSYYINPWDEAYLVGRPAKKVRSPSEVVLVEDGDMFPALRYRKQVMGWHGRFARHNIVFLDFHAANYSVDTRSYHGPGWYVEQYFNIMDFYK